ncbi:MAG: DUF5979 domain-containing protein, partial [Clostridia bacterium]
PDSIHKLNDIAGARVEVVNTRNTAALLVSKTIMGNGHVVEEDKQNHPFRFTLKLSRTDLMNVNGTYACELYTDGTAAPAPYSLVVTNGVASFELKHGQSLHIPHVLVGTQYSVTEDDYSAEGYATNPASRLQAGKITTDQASCTAAFINTRETGKLAISKLVKGNAGDNAKDFAFTLTLTRGDAVSVDETYPCVLTTGNQAANTTLTVTGGKASFTLKHNQTLTVSDILMGTSYTVQEASYFAEGYQTLPQDGKHSGIVASTSIPAMAEYVNTRNAGELTVQKLLDGNDTDQTMKFTFTIQLSRKDGISVDRKYPCTGAYSELTFANGKATVALAGNETITIKDILTDTQYTVTEADVHTQGYFPTPASGVISGAIATGITASASVTNTRNTAELTLLKTLAGNDTDANKPFTMHIALQNDQGIALAGTYRYTSQGGYQPATGMLTVDQAGHATVALKGGQSMTIQGIPVGTAYTVTEDDYSADGYQSSITYPEGYAPHKLDINGALVSVVNTRNTYAALIVSKTVMGSGSVVEADKRNKSFRFTVQLSRTDGMDINGTYLCEISTVGAEPKTYQLKVQNGVGSFELKHGQSLSIPNILTLTHFVVTEDDYSTDGYVTTPTNRVQTGEIPRNQASHTTAFINIRETGKLEISKLVNGNAGDNEKAFAFTLQLARTDGISVDDTYACVLTTGNTAQNTTLTVTGGKASFTLKHNQTLTISDILKDTSYTVTEDRYFEQGYQTLPQDGKRSGTIASTTNSAKAEYVNTRNAGTLSVQKLLDGNATDAAKKFTFTIQLSRNDGISVDRTYACDGGVYSTLTFVNGAATVALAGNERVTIKDVLAGTQYTVTEADEHTQGYFPTLISGEKGTVTADVPANASITNTRNTAELTLLKTLA